MLPETIDTLVVGAGQAGLAASYFLTQHGRDYVVLDRSRFVESWRTGLWDSFTLVTPNWSVQMPGMPYDGDDPDGFMSPREVVEYLEGYAASFDPPLHLGVEVQSVA